MSKRFNYCLLVAVACLGVSRVQAEPYINTAEEYPVPPLREEFAPVEFIEESGTTAIYTIVNTEYGKTETVQSQIRDWLPESHVRRIISDGEGGDQMLMVMWRPKNSFRVDINDYYRVMDGLDFVTQTKTYVGTVDRFPEKFPVDTLIGWVGASYSGENREDILGGAIDTLVDDQDILEVSKIAAGGADIIVTYRFSGRNVSEMLETSSRIKSTLAQQDFIVVLDSVCP